MGNRLAELLEERDYLCADGATGTNAFDMGLKPGSPPDLWNIDKPENPLALYTAFVEAGADIILTNTFGSNPHRLILDKMEHKYEEINVAGAKLARQAADAADRPVVVAGSMGPTGGMMEPFGDLTSDVVEAAFEKQALALAEGGADVIWIETIFAFDELGAAIKGAQKSGLPVASTMTFDTASRTMMGDTPESAVAFVQGFDPGLIAFGANCGAGPSMLIDTVSGLCQASGPDGVVIAKGNCGMPQMVGGKVQYSGTKEVMADYARLARDCDARIIGGCCGTTPEILKYMIDSLRDYEPGEPPSQDRIVDVLGPIKVPTPGSA
ncbi:MAG: betaine--homocysteine S-methyltransferase [Magnetovibrio sp.]|nr:betaine--homocysteine S-methyltransferase [Magnetovibrio sp.]